MVFLLARYLAIIFYNVQRGYAVPCLWIYGALASKASVPIASQNFPLLANSGRTMFFDSVTFTRGRYHLNIYEFLHRSNSLVLTSSIELPSNYVASGAILQAQSLHLEKEPFNQ